MAIVKKFTIDLQKKLAEKLSALPKVAPTELSKRDFVAGLRDQIKFAETQGYTLAQIADVLKGDGVDLSISTLKTYLQNAKPSLKRVKKEKTTVQQPQP